jgi:hypothetical protein
MSTGGDIRSLRTPDELVEIGFARSRVVLVNEAHNGDLRCIRTREIGRRILPTAHAAGVRHLAMESLWSRELIEEANRTRFLPQVADGYLSQPEMRSLIQAALDLDWTLIGYEAGLYQQPPDLDPMGMAFTNWREEQQAANLVRRGIDPFVIDQCVTVEFPGLSPLVAQDLREIAPQLARLGGTAGFLAEETPPPWDRPGVDAVLLSLHNRLE